MLFFSNVYDIHFTTGQYVMWNEYNSVKLCLCKVNRLQFEHFNNLTINILLSVSGKIESPCEHNLFIETSILLLL